LPVGAYGGARELMQQIAPAGPVYQAGTLSGNPLAVTAGIATLKQLKVPGVYRGLEEQARALAEGLAERAKRAGVPLMQTRVGSMMGAFFTKEPVVDYVSAKQSDTQRYAKYFHRMLAKGVYFAPSQFEAAFLSTAHTSRDLAHTLASAYTVFQAL
jgi:glutamate-1-semialdehyde 2,1-aminomutase